jgi:hypothetical protein
VSALPSFADVIDVAAVGVVVGGAIVFLVRRFHTRAPGSSTSLAGGDVVVGDALQRGLRRADARRRRQLGRRP